MVRPSVASLNSLADVLRQAQPAHSEYRSILYYLDNADGILILPIADDSENGSNAVSARKDGDSIPGTYENLYH
jgi:hypothetical protein